MFGTAQQAAESDGTKRVTVSEVASGSYRFLVTFSSLVYAWSFQGPNYNLAQCFEILYSTLLSSGHLKY